MMQSFQFPFLDLLQKLSYPIEEFEEYIDSMLRMREMVSKLFEENRIVVSFFVSKISNIPEVKIFSYFHEDKTLNIHVYLQESNWGVEDKIYEAYGTLIDAFPDFPIDLTVVELYGRSLEEIEDYVV